MLSPAQNTFHHNPRLRGPVSSCILKFRPEIKTETSQSQNALNYSEIICGGEKDHVV